MQPPTSFPAPTILVVDDDVVFSKYLGELLRSAGYNVLEANDGEVAQQHLTQAQPDLLLTDIYMPYVEGIGLILSTRQSDKSIPIIAMSGGALKSAGNYLRVARLLGADATIEKPFDGKELLGLITKALDSQVTQ